MSDKLIHSVAMPPVVSTDPNSSQSKMARDAKLLEVQSSTDSTFDTKLERFVGTQTTILSGLTVALSLLLISLLFQKRR